MKNVLSLLGAVFLCVNGVVGGGFISGKEQGAFFGYETGSFLLSTAVLTLIFYFATVNSKKYNTLNEFTISICGNKSPFPALFFCCSLVCCSVTLNFFENVMQGLNRLKPFPIFSILLIFITAVLFRKGVSKIKKASLILTPLLCLGVFILFFSSKKTELDFSNSLKISHPFYAIIYSFVNFFIGFPCFFEATKGKTNKFIKGVSVVFFLAVSLLGIAVCLSIKGYGKDISSYPVPLIFIAEELGAKGLFSFALILGLITSFWASFYSINLFSKNLKTLVIYCIIICLLSIIGVNGIIKYVYPIFSATGVMYFIKCIKYSRLAKYKNVGGKVDEKET